MAAVMIAQTHVDVATQTHSRTPITALGHTKPQTAVCVKGPGVFAHRYTDTSSTPKENSHPHNNHTSRFYCFGCDGNSKPSWVGGRRPPRRAVPAVLPLPLSPRERTLSFFQHAPLCPPTAVTPSLLHCRLPSNSTFSSQPESRGGAPKDLGSLWLVARHNGLAFCGRAWESSWGVLFPPLLWAGGFWRVGVVRIWLLGPERSQWEYSCGLRSPWASGQDSDSFSLLFILFLLW